MAKKKKNISRDPILAAGGIVTRGRAKPVFAVVRLRGQKIWVLPKGKLAGNETAVAAARREALEETGHEVDVHEFLGSLAYVTSGRPKIVKFWRMEASRKPVAKLMKDVSAVRWLSLDQAIKKLSHERERDFLTRFGPVTRQRLHASPPAAKAKPKKSAGTPAKKSKPAFASLKTSKPAELSNLYVSKAGVVQAIWRWLGR